MPLRKDIYEALKLKMEELGFQFQKEQKPYFQSRREAELKFTHDQLTKRLKSDGHRVNSKIYYIKPLTDNVDAEIGFVTGKSSPFYSTSIFGVPNSIDTFNDTPSWTNKEGDLTLDNLLLSIKKYLHTPTLFPVRNSKTFLFTWNPRKWKWKDLSERIENLEKLGYTERRWSCGNSKTIRKGDRIFLIRVGEEPRGIIGSGYAKSSHYVASHWDDSFGKTANFVDIEFDVLINPIENEIFDKTYLDTIDPENVQQWFPQQSGISIKPEVVDSLESRWFDFITHNQYTSKSFLSHNLTEYETHTFLEGKAKESIQTRYERNPEARKRCLLRYGYSCKVCSFNFQEHFGEIGKEFIHVHHLNQISKIGMEYEINPIKDLIPVCPNCHSMIHSKTPAFSIEEIIKIRKINSISRQETLL